jgi:hypothetical protein
MMLRTITVKLVRIKIVSYIANYSIYHKALPFWTVGKTVVGVHVMATDIISRRSEKRPQSLPKCPQGLDALLKVNISGSVMCR